MPEFIRNEEISSYIMAIGVGGGGGNSVNHLYNSGQKRVLLMLCNTDHQALASSPIPDEFKIQLGNGLGAGNDAENGRRYADESIELIKEVLTQKGIQMVFVIAGMGGGTGTGAGPVIAKAAKDLGILTVGIVTIPFEAEGQYRINQAIDGVDKMSKSVDSLIIINNANIVEMFADLPLSKAFYQSNEIIAKAAYGIAEIINKELTINVDFADVRKIMSNSGVVLMGTGLASGPSRAIEATEMALTSPLLQNQNIIGAKHILMCIISSHENEVLTGEIDKISKYIQEKTQTNNAANLIWGAGYDDSLGDKLQIILIVTGFNAQNIPSLKAYYKMDPGTTITLDNEGKTANHNESGRVLSLDEDNVKTVSIKDKSSKPVKAENLDPDEPFIIKVGSDGNPESNSVTSDSQPKVLVMEDELENENPDDGLRGSKKLENEDEEESTSSNPHDENGFILPGLRKFLNGALVDKTNRH